MNVEDFVEAVKACVYLMNASVFSKCEVGNLSEEEYRVSGGVRALRGLVLCLYFCVLCKVLGV